jgi:Na+/H+ antiporter NhaC
MTDFGLLSLLPALITILVAIGLRQVALALLCGTAGGALIFSGGHLDRAALALWHYLASAFADRERVEIALFVMLVGGLLHIIAASGAYHQFAERLAKYLNTPAKARLSAWVLGFCLFFDDYANLLISGASLKAIFQRNALSFALLAYILDMTAGFASVMLISTWAAFESSLMIDAATASGISSSPTRLFLAAMPYHLYTYFSLGLALSVAWHGGWLGARFDRNHHLLSVGPGNPANTARIGHVLWPLLTLLVTAVGGLFVGGFISLRRQPDLEFSLINLLGNAPTIDILLGATLLSLGLCLWQMQRDKILAPIEMGRHFKTGFVGMLPVALIIIMASGLSKVSGDLGTGQYVTRIIGGLVTPTLLPALIYLIAMIISIATGFSWSSMAIVMPVAYQLALANQASALIPVISAAVISGAITGAQLAPYSDTSVMAAAACQITPLEHVKTQFPEVFLCMLGATGGYLLYGCGLPNLLVYLGPFLLIVGLHRTIWGWWEG